MPPFKKLNFWGCLCFILEYLMPKYTRCSIDPAYLYTTNVVRALGKQVLHKLRYGRLEQT